MIFHRKSVAVGSKFIVHGLIDNHVSLHSRDIGECIYCGARNGQLSTEHAVPYGLNGPWTLLRASCAECAKITTRFEHDVMRRLWPDVRNVLAMQSRRRDKRPQTLPLVLQRDGVRDKVLIPRAKFPTYLPTPLFPPPAALWIGRPVSGVFANLQMIHLCGPTFKEASDEYPGAQFLGMHLNFQRRISRERWPKSAFVPPFPLWASAHSLTLLPEK
jgi:hypothetical protein